MLRSAGRPSEAIAALEQALPLYTQKGDLASATRTRTLRDQLKTPGPARSSLALDEDPTRG
jgi:glycine cleavage system regulatory protein